MNVSDILNNATAEQLMDARDWASDCMGKSAGVKVPAETAVRYVERNYPGGWEGFPREIYPQEAAEPQAQSGYTHCACRDCMDATVSSDTSKPTLCSDCQEAGCVAIAPYNERVQFCSSYECQREDAYTGA